MMFVQKATVFDSGSGHWGARQWQELLDVPPDHGAPAFLCIVKYRTNRCESLTYQSA